MNKDLANFSTDLMRISYWIYHGSDKLAKKFLDTCKENYNNVGPRVGCYRNIWQEIEKVSDFGKNRLQAAERALTLSRILIMYS